MCVAKQPKPSFDLWVFCWRTARRWWSRFDIPDNCLSASLDIDLTDSDFFRFCTAALVERLDEFISHRRAIYTVSKIKVPNLQITRTRKCRLGETVKTGASNANGKHC